MKNIDELVSKILNEEIENKVNEFSKIVKEEEWTEIEVDEELKGGQKKLDVAEPKGKLTADDFKKLRSMKKKKEVEEHESLGDYHGDDFEREEAEELSAQEPTYVGRGLKDNKIMAKVKNKMFDLFHEEFDEEVEEGNAFSGALANAKKHHKDSFEVDGKTYPVKEAKEKWIQKTKMHKGALHKKLGVPEGDKIPVAKLKALKKELTKKGEGDKKLSASDLKLLKQVNLALTLKSVKESTSSLKLTENELIDMIEKIVLEQKVKDTDEKNNITKKEPQGLKKTNKVLDLNKKENEDYAKEVVKKMKDYVKAGSKGEYTESPVDFPKTNYQMDKDAKIMKYNPSEAVDEYIEAFSYPGMTNLVYDEIKPDDKKISKYLQGDKTTGNAEVDEDGKALGNVVPSKVGERFKKNYDENLYGAEQKNVSYKRQSQPVDVAGENTVSGSLKSKKGGQTSTQKAQKIMNQLESSEDKKSKLISEEMSKMKNLIGYNRKTQ